MGRAVPGSSPDPSRRRQEPTILIGTYIADGGAAGAGQFIDAHLVGRRFGPVLRAPRCHRVRADDGSGWRDGGGVRPIRAIARRKQGMKPWLNTPTCATARAGSSG